MIDLADVYTRADKSCDYCKEVTGPLLEWGGFPSYELVCAPCLRTIADELEDVGLNYTPAQRPVEVEATVLSEMVANTLRSRPAFAEFFNVLGEKTGHGTG